MSDWHGPSTYMIASARDTKCRVALHNGLKADDTKVITWSNLTSKNDHWDFVFAGHGVSGKDEYLIVCRNSGTYLSSAKNLKDGACTGNTLPTRDNRVRWNVIPTRSGREWYWIVPAHDQSMGLALTRGEAKDEAVIRTTGRRNDVKSFAWCLLLADDTMINCPDVGEGFF